MSLASIVLAAGRGTRFGDVPKLLATLDEKPLVRHVVEAARAAAPVAGGVRVAARPAALCYNPATAAVAPLRHRFAVASSHLVITEPVPDVVAELGWAGGESITDGPTLIEMQLS